MTTNEETRIEEHNGKKYVLEAVEYQKKGVGLAPTLAIEGESADDQLDFLLQTYGSALIVSKFERQNKQDAKNAVRGKFNKDKVSATTIINAQASGELTIEMMASAKKDYDAGKYDHNWTKCCAAQLGLGEDALAHADSTHIHWDCAK